ncbi:MAG: sulfur transfer protein involved in thiamine biosynthesis [Pseudomonadota bacterium]|jgi:sulfur carrier protein
MPTSDPNPLQVTINQQPHTLPAGATLSDAIARIGIQPPFAAAVNLQFVPRAQHAMHALHDGDRIELIVPITGG